MIVNTLVICLISLSTVELNVMLPLFAGFFVGQKSSLLRVLKWFCVPVTKK